MNTNYKKDARGFTLIELLAVIVVLAIVILMAVQAVIPQLQEAKKNVLAMEANNVIDAANTYLMNNGLSNGKLTLPVNDGAYECVDIEELIKAGQLDMDIEKYEGSVKVQKSGNIYLFTVWLHNKNEKLMVNGKGVEDNSNKNISGSDVEDYTNSFGKCTKATTT